MLIYKMTLNDYLALVASKSPTPGGGSVSAVAAANAAAMVSMVANLTLKKKGYEAVQPQVEEILEKVTQAIEKLKDLTSQDMQAFENLMAAWRLPSENDGQKEIRTEALEKAAQEASTVPLEICRVCLEILKMADSLAPIGNKNAISDVGVGAYLAEASLKAAMLNVDINLPSIKDETFRLHLISEKERLFREAEELKTSALEKVMARL